MIAGWFGWQCKQRQNWFSTPSPPRHLNLLVVSGGTLSKAVVAGDCAAVVRWLGVREGWYVHGTVQSTG